MLPLLLNVSILLVVMRCEAWEVLKQPIQAAEVEVGTLYEWVFPKYFSTFQHSKLKQQHPSSSFHALDELCHVQ